MESGQGGMNGPNVQKNVVEDINSEIEYVIIQPQNMKENIVPENPMRYKIAMKLYVRSTLYY